MIKILNISLSRVFKENISISSDSIGAFASGLCMLHCLATPIFLLFLPVLLLAVTMLLHGGNGWIICF